MTKAELIEDIARRSHLSRAQAKLAVECFIGSVTDTLKKGEEVRIVGFGSFTPVKRAAGMARNPRTGARVTKLASTSARFRVGEALRSALN